MKLFNVPGVSIAVIDDYEIAWAKGYGVQERKTSVPVTTDTLFQAASISKPVTALAVMLHRERGTFDLDTNINLYLKSWRVPDNEWTQREKVTLRRLLSHSAGTTVHGFPGYKRGDQLPTVPQILDGVAPANTAPVRVDVLPGSITRYSGGGTTIAQLALEDTLGQPFAQIMETTVLKPLGLARSTYAQPLPAALEGQAASGHYASGAAVDQSWHVYPEQGAAGLWTTPSELARIAIHVARSKAGHPSPVVSSALAQEMLREQVVGSNIGIGFMLKPSVDAERFGHGGSNEGFRCELLMDAKSGDGVVIMTNSDAGTALFSVITAALADEYDWPGQEAFVPRPHTRLGVLVRLKGVDAMLKEYEALRQQDPGLASSPDVLNEVGYHLLSADKVTEAIQVFVRNTELFAKNANAYDSLGEAYFVAGDFARSRQSYKKSLKLDPKNQNARDRLKKIEKSRAKVSKH